MITTCLDDTPLIPTVSEMQPVIRGVMILDLQPYALFRALNMPKVLAGLSHLGVRPLNGDHVCTDAPSHGELKCTISIPYLAMMWVHNVPTVMGSPMKYARRSALLPCTLA